MARAVYRKNKNGKVTYVGHVPPEYQLRMGEHFYPDPYTKSDDKETLQIVHQLNKYHKLRRTKWKQ